MKHLKTCQKILRENKHEAFLVSDFYNIGYLSGFFPLSPQEREVFLLLTPKENLLITDGRYIEQAKAQSTGFTCLAINTQQNFFQLIATCCQKLEIKSLAFEKENLTVSEYEKLKVATKPIRLITAQNIVEERRAVKDDSELSAIKKACQVADECFTHLLDFLKPGLTEKEVADEIEWFIRKKGAVDLSFDPIVAFGSNSAFPHHRTSHKPLAISDKLILLDFGAKGENYCSDMTRVVFLGKATAEQKKVYQTVLDAQKLAIEHLGKFTSDGGPERSRRNSSKVESSGIEAKSIDKIARDYITSHGYPTIPHSLGHGVGLCEHELPRLSPESKDVLKPGMVFSIEPGIYLPAEASAKAGLPENFGIRIEDLVVLTPSGPQILTKSPKQLIEE